jgi:hypothetical protein
VAVTDHDIDDSLAGEIDTWHQQIERLRRKKLGRNVWGVTEVHSQAASPSVNAKSGAETVGMSHNIRGVSLAEIGEGE